MFGGVQAEAEQEAIQVEKRGAVPRAACCSVQLMSFLAPEAFLD